ncbi:J domain-containing protein [Massilia litorea]|uniref:J domain-containing protein n=1 Tax=Massilia litorea TaxID=2769491 RepID=A0A7L9U5V5_9BURK|nr:J domain-containing protein [Massilia litorea]QOL50230.1 J domain-containing protein [Massilia litorea]
MKNYYSVLGVLPTAELAVIRAAYRALCQIYHPDKYSGNKDYAEALTKELNEAWSVLSDAEKRRQYDKAIGSQQQFADTSGSERVEQPFRETLIQSFPELQTIAEYYFDIWDLIERLQKVSRQLATGFVATLLQTKAYKGRAELAKQLEQRFFISYFGKDKRIQEFARGLIAAGNREAALELNKAVTIFGSGIEADLIINKISVKYDLGGNDPQPGFATSAQKDRNRNPERSARQNETQHDASSSDQSIISHSIKRLEKMRSAAYLPSPNDWLSATKTLRSALEISLTFKSSRKSMFSSEEIAVFHLGKKTWDVPLKSQELRVWVTQELIPMAERKLQRE